MNNYKRRKVYTLVSSVILLFILVINSNTPAYSHTKSDTYDKNELEEALKSIYSTRSMALASSINTDDLNQLFDTSQKYGNWALEHEIKRCKYLTQWAKDRNMTFTNIDSFIRIKKIYPNGKIFKLALEESYKFDYLYNDSNDTQINSFGVGIRHTASIIKRNEKWVIYSDWYTDCFEDALQGYTLTSSIATPPKFVSLVKPLKTVSSQYKGYNREKAVEYADKYCGAAWGSGNDYKYNKKFSDYNGIGGDCTNFVSQVLGAKEAGALPVGGGWSPGSSSWVNADGLKNYLLWSGRGSIIKIGTYKELISATNKYPLGAVEKLQLGDLIAYEKGRGNIDHFAVITGFDSHGYPLVNSHTTDRYHVPWDLGWGDKKIRFYLIHIK